MYFAVVAGSFCGLLGGRLTLGRHAFVARSLFVFALRPGTIMPLILIALCISYISIEKPMW